jgi:hypothetical protein
MRNGRLGRCLSAIVFRRLRLVWLVALVCAGLATGCERDDPLKAGKTGKTAAAPRDDPDRVPPPAIPPEYYIADDLRDQYPEVVAFLQQFMETCLAGDYAGYRKLVSRQCDPENRDRFHAVLQAIRVLRVESIEPVELPRLSPDAYVVVSRVEFHPESKARLRRRHDQVAILVLTEEGHWRMMPAPPEWQPTPRESTASASAPASEPIPTTAPSYPWDEDGDF